MSLRIFMEQFPFFVWEYEEQTKRKHLVFQDYFDKWIKILGKFNNLNYIDCYGGCGAYKDKDDQLCFGSPIIAIQTIKNNQIKLNRNVSIVIIDSKKENLQNIGKILEYLKLDISPAYVYSDFDTAINKLLDKYPNLAPTFFFVDPFGFSIKLSTLKRIMERPKSEIFLNFMFNGVNRFLTLPQNEKIFNELFGSNNWKSLCNNQGKDREKCILDSFLNELKKFSKFVYPYRMCFSDMEARTYYYLIHLTNNYKGCQIMKSCFAKYHFGRTEFLGKKEVQRTLDEIDVVRDGEIKKFLLSKYSKSKKSFIDICEENICDTEYLESDFYGALKELEKENKINIQRNPPLTKTGKNRESIKYEDMIIFI